jgi:hypothetical protein
MSDRLSPESLGKELYILYEIFVNGNTRQEAIADSNTVLDSYKKTDWERVAEDFCKYLKEAEADS